VLERGERLMLVLPSFELALDSPGADDSPGGLAGVYAASDWPGQADGVYADLVASKRANASGSDSVLFSALRVTSDCDTFGQGGNLLEGMSVTNACLVGYTPVGNATRACRRTHVQT
jgi:hypothetical protein